MMKYDRNAEEIVIADGTACIREKEFYGFKRLKSVTIPNSVEDLQWDAFGDCSALEKLRIPERLLSSPAFFGCDNITTVEIAPGTIKIGKSGLPGFPHLKTVVLPEGLLEIGDHAFAGCACLSSIIIPDSVQEIRDGAFAGCTNLTSVKLPPGLRKLRTEVFSGCTGLREVMFPENLAVIGSRAFSGCTGLVSATLPPSVKVIGNGAFSCCTNLREVVFGRESGKIRIDENAFESCARTPLSIRGCGNSHPTRSRF